MLSKKLWSFFVVLGFIALLSFYLILVKPYDENTKPKNPAEIPQPIAALPPPLPNPFNEHVAPPADQSELPAAAIEHAQYDLSLTKKETIAFSEYYPDPNKRYFNYLGRDLIGEPLFSSNIDGLLSYAKGDQVDLTLPGYDEPIRGTINQHDALSSGAQFVRVDLFSDNQLEYMAVAYQPTGRIEGTLYSSKGTYKISGEKGEAIAIRRSILQRLGGYKQTD